MTPGKYDDEDEGQGGWVAHRSDSRVAVQNPWGVVEKNKPWDGRVALARESSGNFGTCYNRGSSTTTLWCLLDPGSGAGQSSRRSGSRQHAVSKSVIAYFTKCFLYFWTP